MSRKAYHKLVRDRIPEIIERSGKTCSIRTLDEQEYLRMLDEKVQEEMQEYLESKAPDELCDLIEVIYAIAIARGYSIRELEDMRLRKRSDRGGFEKRLLLEDVTDPEPNAAEENTHA